MLCAEWRSKKSPDSESSLSSLYYKQFTLEWPSGWPSGDKIKISQENLIQKPEISRYTFVWLHQWEELNSDLWSGLMTSPRSRPRDLGAEKIAQIEFDGFEGDHLRCVRLNNSEPWHWWELLLVGIDADTRYWCEIMSRLFVPLGACYQ